MYAKAYDVTNPTKLRFSVNIPAIYSILTIVWITRIHRKFAFVYFLDIWEAEMAGKKSEWVYDELLCFLGSAFFHVPVDGFIEAKCLSKID